MDTDEFIQQSLARQFRRETVITIAHRLKTIIEVDKVLVLDDGQIVEFDSPKRLMKKRRSLFKDLIDNSRDADELYRIVQGVGTQF